MGCSNSKIASVSVQLKKDAGFTLVEVLMVVVILSVLAAITIPKLNSSSDTARRNADVATAHQVKSALDRYQAENGVYPLALTELSAASGKVTSTNNFIPKYVSKLDTTTTQQRTTDNHKGFAVTKLDSNGLIPTSTTATNLIMIYLADDGSGAEVQAYDAALTKVIWSSGN